MTDTPNLTFDDPSLSPSLMAGLREAGFQCLTPLHQKVIPLGRFGMGK